MSDNPQAFSGMEYDPTAGQRYHYGMTLRDYFAGQVLAGLSSINDDRSKPAGKDLNEWREEIYKEDAAYCYMVADAMLKERNKHE